MFEIASAPILAANPEIVPHVGGIVTFEGVVRDVNEGLAVTALEYEALAPLAVKEGERILQEAREKFAVVDITCVHRVGRLGIGEVAIRVVATSMHRRAAFEACEYVVDEVKARVPIWKKEHYADGESGWVNCQKIQDDARREAL